MHTQTEIVRTALYWLACTEKPMVGELTAVYFPAPSHRSSHGSSVTHIHTQTHWLSHPIVWLLQQACSMSPQHDTYMSTRARLHSGTHSHLPSYSKNHIHKDNTLARSHAYCIWVKKESWDTSFWGFHLHRKKQTQKKWNDFICMEGFETGSLKEIFV